MDISEKITTKGEHNVTFHVDGRPDGQAYYSPKNTNSEYGLVLIQ
jgi:hypothetical protein